MKSRQRKAQPGCLVVIFSGSQKGIMRSAITVAVAVLALAGGMAGSSRAANGDNQPVATVSGHAITLQELDAKVMEDIPKSQLYNLRKQALDQMIDQSVVDAAAKKANLSPADYLKT